MIEGVSTDLLLDAIDGGIVVLDRRERIVQWNAWMVSATGRTAADVLGKSLSDVFPGLDLSRLTSAVKATMTSGASTILTRALNPSPLPLLTRSGRTLLHDITVSPAPGGEAAACLIFILDVTMATRREQYLRDQQNARYDAIVEGAPDVILTIDPDDTIRLANPAAVAQFGYGLNELLGKRATDLFETKSEWTACWREAFEGAPSVRPKELIAVRKNDTRSYVEASASRWSSGARTFVTVILRDVNERRAVEAAARAAAEALAELNQTLEQRVEERTAQLMKTEEALRQSQKMEAIGQLTGGIAHDFNNLLQGIIGALHVINKRISAGRLSDIDRFTTGALESANRAAALTHRLLSFSRQQPVDPQPLDENQLIAAMEELLRRALGETVQMTFAPAPDLWLVRCDANQLENAVLNLAINARDAMPNGGKFTIETSNEVLHASQAILRSVPAGEYVRLVVRDTGTGMPPDIQARIFEPFFTTKPLGKGTGLGLSMIYGFIRQSDGAVAVESELGKGTAIEIYLPRFRGDLETPSIDEQTVHERRARSDEVVLVVEDEPMVRLLVVEVLKDLGYHALEAENGVSATRILHSAQRIDLLVTDVGLPDMSGRHVADAAMAARKDLKVLFMTGYADKAAGDTFMDEDREIITKPFAMDVLSARIREMIEGEGEGKRMRSPIKREIK